MVAKSLNTLILEDDPDHAQLLKLELRRLSELAFEFTHCMTCEQAIDRVDAEDFDLIFVDYWLEGETTEGFLDQLQQARRGIPIVVTTSANDEYVAASVIRSGAHRYIRKTDLSSTRLRQAIRDAMHDSQAAGRKSGEFREAAGKLALLTPREREIAKLIGRGLLSKQIALELGCTEGTVNLHRSHILSKTGAQSVADVVRMVMVSDPDR